MEEVAPKPRQTREVRKNKVIDFEDDFKNHRRCPACKRLTNGIEDFKHLTTGRVVKTCIHCRKCIYKSLKARPRPEHKYITNADRLDGYALLNSYIDEETLKSAKEKLISGHPDKAKVAEVIFNEIFLNNKTKTNPEK
jgi:hypothetical protein